MVNSPKLRIIPLGGIDEFGKNITVFEYDKDIIVVDCGSMFPKDDMLGIDLVIPDASISALCHMWSLKRRPRFTVRA